MKRVMITFFVVFFVLTACFCLLGCKKSARLHNVDNAQLPLKIDGEHHSVEAVERAIVTACENRGWSPKVVSPGHIVATLYIRTHVAVVDIYYTENSFDIKYKDSTNLNYKGSTIHPRYNTWIKYLEEDIFKFLNQDNVD